MRGEQQLRRHLHLQLVLRQLEDGEVLLLPLVVGDSPFVSIISCEPTQNCRVRKKQGKPFFSSFFFIRTINTAPPLRH